ncbi:hypothetical protein CB1_000384001 [Camelus ferus]|nr:hypothetical protein CB1_000384001 [Camelus ferus]
MGESIVTDHLQHLCTIRIFFLLRWPLTNYTILNGRRPSREHHDDLDDSDDNGVPEEGRKVHVQSQSLGPTVSWLPGSFEGCYDMVKAAGQGVNHKTPFGTNWRPSRSSENSSSGRSAEEGGQGHLGRDA